jgi:quinol monooxygenase YgiN
VVGVWTASTSTIGSRRSSPGPRSPDALCCSPVLPVLNVTRDQRFAMLCLNIFLTAQDAADVDTIRSLLQQAMQLSREEPGCLRFDAYHSTADVRRFTLVEHWESQEALDAHRLGKAYTEIYKPQVMPLVEREGHPSELLG